MSKKSSTKNDKLGLVYFALLVLLLSLIFGTGFYAWSNRNVSSKTQPSNASTDISSYEECVAAGNPVMESYPEQCAANGQTFVNEQQKLSYIGLKDIEATLSSVIKESANEERPYCKNDSDKSSDEPSMGVERYVAGRAATVFMGCADGGAIHLFAYSEGVWKDVGVTQMGFGCKVVDKYKVPSSVVSVCFDEKGATKQVTYQ